MRHDSRLRLKLLAEPFGILKLPPTQRFPVWVADAPIFFVARTEDEFSVMCPQRYIPANVPHSAGWLCLRVDGDLLFDEVGVAARVSRPLADAGLSIFLVSTHDRDYVMIAEKDLQSALTAYEKAGFHIVNHSNIALIQGV